jgi:hypothetical protein
VTVAIKGDFLVERFASDVQVRRRARIVPEQPKGAKRSHLITAEDGRKYVTGWVYAPGIRQGRAVAWATD